MIPIEHDKHVYITGNLEQLLKKKKSVQKDLPKMVKVMRLFLVICNSHAIVHQLYLNLKIYILWKQRKRSNEIFFIDC